MFRNSMTTAQSGIIGLHSDRPTLNFDYLQETNFSIIQPDVLVWDGELPFKPGDIFPTPHIQERANMFLTNEKLYSNKYDGILDELFSLNDYMRDAITNMNILRLLPSLPDYSTITDQWVELMASTPPRIDGEDDTLISGVSNLLESSNLASFYQATIRGALFMYGNYVCRVDKQSAGNISLIEMPVKLWLPFVSPASPTSIEVNVFFNIFKRPAGDAVCEFLLYFEDGHIEKHTYAYYPEATRLGELLEVEHSEAFEGLGVSPIVVFTGKTLGGVEGMEQFRYWDAAIASCIRNYSALLYLVERTKEIYRILPDGATTRDNNTGITYLQQSGVIAYSANANSEHKAPEAHMIVPEVRMTEAVAAYNESLMRLSRDTGLAYSIFNPASLGSSSLSAAALRTHLWRTELKAKSMQTLLNASLKELICKMGLAGGFDLAPSDFQLLIDSGFISDDEAQTSIVQSRLGGQASLTLEQAISTLDKVPMSQARKMARELQGLPPDLDQDQTSLTTDGGQSTVSDLTLDPLGKPIDSGVQTAVPLESYVLGGRNIETKQGS